MKRLASMGILGCLAVFVIGCEQPSEKTVWVEKKEGLGLWCPGCNASMQVDRAVAEAQCPACGKAMKLSDVPMKHKGCGGGVTMDEQGAMQCSKCGKPVAGGDVAARCPGCGKAMIADDGTIMLMCPKCQKFEKAKL